jgi:hypothetical protein
MDYSFFFARKQLIKKLYFMLFRYKFIDSIYISILMIFNKTLIYHAKRPKEINYLIT